MFANKELWLPPPQFYELARLSRKSDVEDVIKFAKNRERHGTTLFLPVQYKLKDAMLSAYPGDDLYVENPNECTELIELDEEIEECNKNAKNTNRCCFASFHNNFVEMNIEPSNKHIKPVTREENGISSKL